MADSTNQGFNFDINANSQQAQDELAKLRAMVRELEDVKVGIEAEVNLGTVDTGAVDDYMNKLINVSRQSNRTSAQMTKDVTYHKVRPQGTTEKEHQTKLTDNQGKLQQASNAAYKEYAKLLESHAINTRRTVSSSKLPNANMYERTSADSRRDLDYAQSLKSDLKGERTKLANLGDIARSTGNMTYAQSSRYRSTTDNFNYKYQGITQDEAERVEREGETLTRDKTVLNPDSTRYQALDAQDKASENIRVLQDDLQNLATDEQYIGNESLRRSVEEKTLKNLKEQEKILTKNQEIIGVLDNAFDEVLRERKAMQETLDSGKNIMTAPDPNSAEGRRASRASATALAMVGAVTASIGKSINDGLSVAQSQRPESQTIGFRTGDYDFRSIRESAMESGQPYGVMGDEALNYMSTILGSRGMTTDEDLGNATTNAIEFSKVSGGGQENSLALTEALSQTGASSLTVQSIQEGVLGAIQSSGMQGREEEQIKALTSIVDQGSRGQNVSEEDLNSRIAMTNMLAATGDRALQGANLQDFVSSADQSIKGAAMNPYSDSGLLLGMGTDPAYMGVEGMTQFIDDMQNGLNAENFNTLASNALAVSSGDPDKAAQMLYFEGMTGDLDINSTVSLLEDFLAGNLSEEQIKETFGEDKQTGQSTMDERLEGYLGSPDADREQLEANEQRINSNLVENPMSDMLFSALGGISGSLGGSVLGSMLYSGGKGLASGGAVNIGSSIWSKVGDMISSGYSTNWTDFMGRSKGGVTASTDPINPKGPKGTSSGFRNLFKRGTDVDPTVSENLAPSRGRNRNVDATQTRPKNTVADTVNDTIQKPLDVVDDVADGVSDTITQSVKPNKGVKIKGYNTGLSKWFNTSKKHAGNLFNSDTVQDTLKNADMPDADITDEILKTTGKSTGLLSKVSPKVAKVLPKVGKGLGFAGTAIDAVQSIGAISQADNKAEEAVAQTGKVVGSGLGAKGGIAAGAAIGTAIFPGLGTVVGGALGGIAGGMLGSNLGEKGGRWAGEELFGEKESSTDPNQIAPNTINTDTINLNASTLNAPNLSQDTEYGVGGIPDYTSEPTVYNDPLSVGGMQPNPISALNTTIGEDTVANAEQAKINADLKKEELRQNNISLETANISAWEALLTESQGGLFGSPTSSSQNLGNTNLFGGMGGTVSQEVLNANPYMQEKIAREKELYGEESKQNRQGTKEVVVNTTVNYTGTGNPEADGRSIANGINQRFTTELARI